MQQLGHQKKWEDIVSLFHSVKEKNEVLNDLNSYCCVMRALYFQKKYDEIFSLYEEIISKKISSNETVLKLILNSLVETNQIPKILKVLQAEEKNSPPSFQLSPYIYEHAVRLLSVTKDFQIIKEFTSYVKNKLEDPNVIYQAFIQYFTQLNNEKELFAYLKDLKSSNSKFNVITYCYIFKSLMKFKKGHLTIHYIREVKHQKELLDNRLIGLILSSLEQFSMSEQAIEFYEFLKRNSFQFDLLNYNSLLEVLVKTNEHKSLEMIQKIILEMKKLESTFPNSTSLDILVKFSRKLNFVEFTSFFKFIQDERLLNNLAPETANHIQFQFFLLQSGKKGKISEIIEAFENFKDKHKDIPPTTYAILIDQLGKSGNVTKMLYYFKEMKAKKIPPNLFIYSALLLYLRKEKENDILNEVLDIFKEMNSKNFEISLLNYNFILSILAGKDNFSLMESLIQEMKAKNIKFDKFTYTTILTALAKQRKMEEILSTLQIMKEKNIEIDEITLGSLFQYFPDPSLIEKLEPIFHSLPSMSSIAYSNLLRIYASSKNWDKFIQIFNKCKAEKRIDVVIFTLAVKAFSDFKAFDLLDNVLAEMKELHIEPDSLLFSALIKTNSINGRISQVIALFEDIKSGDIPLTGALVHSFLFHVPPSSIPTKLLQELENMLTFFSSSKIRNRPISLKEQTRFFLFLQKLKTHN